MTESVLVDNVKEIGPGRDHAKSADAKVKVVFAGGTVATLDTANPRERVWIDVLSSLQASHEPAYVGFDSRTQRITSLLLPRKYAVVGIGEVPEAGDLRLELHPSHAVHYLRRVHPRFAALKKLLVNAQRTKRVVLVTESLDSSAIVDVRRIADQR